MAVAAVIAMSVDFNLIDLFSLFILMNNLAIIKGGFLPQLNNIDILQQTSNTIIRN